jgi:hypothetical protein
MPGLPLPSAFPYHQPGTALQFPRDEGWHRFLPLQPFPGHTHGLANPSLEQMEWVYLNSHLTEVGGAGRSFVVFAAYFTQALRFLVVRGWDASGAPLGTWTGSAWGALTPSPEGLDLQFKHLGGTDTWQTLTLPDGTPRPFCSRLIARDDAAKFTVDLSFVNTKAPYCCGGVGWLPFGESGSFNYYSLSRLTTDGHLTLQQPSGVMEDIHVAGRAWFDHQWGPFFVTPFRLPGLDQYEWMSVQLDSGDEFLLTTVWDRNNQTPSQDAYGGAGWIHPDGSSQLIARADLWERTGFWRSPEQGYVYSSGWRFKSAEWGVDLTITPRQKDQLTPFVDPPIGGPVGDVLAKVFGGAPNALGEFWEGSCTVTGTLGGAPVTGVAFAELIKRYDDPVPLLKLVRHEPGLTVVGWRVGGWDQQAPLRFQASIEQPDGTVLKTVPDLALPVLVLDDPYLPTGTPLRVRVVVSSIDGTLKGTQTLDVSLK